MALLQEETAQLAEAHQAGSGLGRQGQEEEVEPRRRIRCSFYHFKRVQGLINLLEKL